MDNVIVVSDDDEDEAKDVVNGDSNSESKVLWLLIVKGPKKVR